MANQIFKAIYLFDFLGTDLLSARLNFRCYVVIALRKIFKNKMKYGNMVSKLGELYESGNGVGTCTDDNFG